MKLVVTVVQDYDTDRLLQAITDAGFGATRIASTGGFLQTGNTTLLMGVAEERIDQCLDVIAAACRGQPERPSGTAGGFPAKNGGANSDLPPGGAVAFVLTVARFERFDAENPPPAPWDEAKRASRGESPLRSD